MHRLLIPVDGSEIPCECWSTQSSELKKSVTLNFVFPLFIIRIRYYTTRSRYTYREKKFRSYRKHTAGISCGQQSK